MSDNFWSVFCDTGEPLCYLLCKAQEQERTPVEVKPIPNEFQMDPPHRAEPVSPQCRF